jgi:hypothetical protein
VKINVMLGGKTVWNNGVPSVIGGSLSQMDESALEKSESRHENENEIVSATEYWLAGELVHRSVHVHLKKNPIKDFAGAVGAIG